MLNYKLVEFQNGKVLYKYFPENGSAFGLVSFDTKTDTAKIETLAENDRHERYALKLFKFIREMARKGTFEKAGLIVWY